MSLLFPVKSLTPAKKLNTKQANPISATKMDYLLGVHGLCLSKRVQIYKESI